MSVFTDNLDTLIKGKGITIARLLKDLDLGKNSFLNWNNRDTLPNGNTIIKLADYFGITLDTLVGRNINNINRKEMQYEFIIGNSFGQLAELP